MRLLHEIAIFQTVKSKVIISLFETVKLSVSISLRNLYKSLNSIKERRVKSCPTLKMKSTMFSKVYFQQNLDTNDSFSLSAQPDHM